MHLGRNFTYECCVSQSVFFEVLNAVRDDVLKRKYLKIRNERLDTNYCQVQGWKLFAYVSITKRTFEGHEISITKKIVLIWKWKAHFIQLHNLVHNFWRKYHKVHVSSPWCMHALKVSTRDPKNSFNPLNYLYVDS